MKVFSISKLALGAALTLSVAGANAQVKIGNNNTTIDPAAILELEHPNKALYLTRVSLTSTSDMTTVPNPKEGMVVYNNNPGIVTINPAYLASGVGIYYFNGVGWVYSGVGNLTSQFWSLNGNANAADGVNFLGTTNNVALNFRVNNQRAGRIDLAGNTTLGYQAAATMITTATLNNTLIGTSAGTSVTNGSNNTGVGNSALLNIGTGINNTAVGQNAGATYAGAFNNTFIGQGADATSSTVNGGTALGQGAQVSQSNSVILGNAAASVGIGNSAPNSKLHVLGNAVGGFPFGTNNTFYSGIYSRPTRPNAVGTDISYGVLSHASATNNIGTYNAVAGRILRNSDTSIANLTAALGHVSNPLNFQTALLGITNSRTDQSSDTQVFSGLRITDATTGLTPAQEANTYSVYSSSPRKAYLEGSVGVGTNAPSNKLHVVGTDPLRLEGLQNGASTDSVLTVASGGVVRRSNVGSLGGVTAASNGLTKSNDTVRLGGTLTAPTVIATAGNDLNITGTGRLFLDSSVNAGSLAITNNATVGGSTTTGSLNVTNGSVTNGITNTGDVATGTLTTTGAATIGGAATVAGTLGVTGATTTAGITNTGNITTTSLTANGLLNGASTDSILTIAPGGVVRRVDLNTIGGLTTASNGLTKTGNDIKLGGQLIQATNIDKAGNTLTFSGAGNVGINTTAPTNAVEIVATGVNGTGVSSGQGLNVNATSANNPGGRSMGTVSRMDLPAGSTVSELRGISAATTVEGTITPAAGVVGNAAGGVLISTLNGGTLSPNATLTGVAADARVQSGTTDSSNTVIGGRLGANSGATTTSAANAIGVLATAQQSSNGNIGVLAISGDDQTLNPATLAKVGGAAAAITGGGGAAVVAISATNNANDRALYTDGKVQLAGTLGTSTPTQLVGIDAAGNLSRTNGNNLVVVRNGLSKDPVDSAIELGGNLTQATTIDQDGNTLTLTDGTVDIQGALTTNGITNTGGISTTGNTSTSTLTATGLATSTSAADSILNVNNGVVSKVSPSTILSAIRANNGLTRVADSIQLGGALTKPTTITADATNNLVIQSTGVGGPSVEANQGLNVLATAATSANAIGVRGRVLVPAGVTVGQARGASGSVTISGTVSGSANGGYFNNNLSGATLGAGASASGTSADVEATGTNSVNATNALIGGRFGSNAANATAARSVGVLGSAANGVINIGALGVANDITNAGTEIQAAGAELAGGSAAVAAVNQIQTGNNLALYTRGGVRLKNLPATGNTSLVGIDGAGNLSTTAIPAAVTASNGLNRDVNDIQLGGPLTEPTTVLLPTATRSPCPAQAMLRRAPRSPWP